MEKEIANIPAERALLAGILIGSTKISEVRLSIPDFYDAFSRDVFQAVLELDNDGLKVDIVSVSQKIGSEKFDALAELLGMPEGLLNFSQYEKSIADLSSERQKQSFVNDYKAGKLSSSELIEKLQEHITKQPNVDIFTAADYSDADIEKFQTNDEYIFGFKAQYPAMCIIAGATSTGKTEYMLEIADHFARKEDRLTLFCEFEGTKEDMLLRLAKKRIKNPNFWIMIDPLFSEINNFVAKNPDKKTLIIIDYLQMFARTLQARDQKSIENIRFYTNRIYQNFKGLKNRYKNVCICFLSNFNNQGIRDITKEAEINPLTLLTSIKEDGNIAYDVDYAYALLFSDDKEKWYLSRFALDGKGRKFIILAKIKSERHGLPVVNRVYRFESGRYRAVINEVKNQDDNENEEKNNPENW